MRGKRFEGRKNKQPVALSNLFTADESSYTINKIKEVNLLKNIWVKAVKGKLVEIAFPFRLNNGILYVAVKDSAWMSELPYFKDDIMERLNSLGLEVNNIRFVLSKIPPPKKEPEKKLRPLTDAEKNTIAEMASSIKDEGLRQAYIDALTACIGADRLVKDNK